MPRLNNTKQSETNCKNRFNFCLYFSERETAIVEALIDHFNTKLAGLQEYIDNAPAAF